MTAADALRLDNQPQLLPRWPPPAGMAMYWLTDVGGKLVARRVSRPEDLEDWLRGFAVGPRGMFCLVPVEAERSAPP